MVLPMATPARLEMRNSCSPQGSESEDCLPRNERAAKAKRKGPLPKESGIGETQEMLEVKRSGLLLLGLMIPG